MDTPTMANVALPNNIPTAVAPVAMIASNGTTSFLSFCVIFFLVISYYSYRKYTTIILYTKYFGLFFHLIFSGAKTAVSVLFCALLCRFFVLSSSLPLPLPLIVPTFAQIVNRTFILYKIIK